MSIVENSIPRRVPLSLQIRLLLGGQFWWYFVGFALLFVWALGSDAKLAILLGVGDRYIGTTTGTVVECGEITDKDGTPVRPARYWVRCQYLVDGESFMGYGKPRSRPCEPGAKVEIKYLKTNRDMNPWPGKLFFYDSLCSLIPLVLVTAGLCGFVCDVRRRDRIRRLIESGVYAPAKVVQVETRELQPGSRTYRHFAYRGFDGTTKYAEDTIGRRKREKRPPDHVVYDPKDPEWCFVLGDQVGSPWVDETGQLRVLGAWKTVFYLILPVFVICLHSILISPRIKVLLGLN